VAEYEEVYLKGMANLIDWLSKAPPRKFIYTSSTGVYGQTDGSRVKEDSPTEPAVETAKVLVATERLILDAWASQRFPGVILRVAGIYGPDRTHFLKQFIANEVKIPGAGDRYRNMIHLEDLVQIIGVALKAARPGEIYNTVDDEPVMEVHFYRWLSETLGKWMPPFTPETDEAARKRGTTNKRVLNRKLKMELGYHFKYPTFRQGYTAEIQRLQEAGLLVIEPEPR
jgi:nucleoside-diphosphate-sugar epimerase